jgi:predicted  nucleic acid-binding Zn-ribbon protein
LGKRQRLSKPLTFFKREGRLHSTGRAAPVNPDLRKLIALQDIEKNIAVLHKKVSEIPLKTNELEAAAGCAKAAYEEKAALAKEFANRRRSLEGEVELAGTKLSRLKDQLMAVKTNKEYTAMLSEIKTAEKHIRDDEDKILDLMEEIESGDAAMKLAETEMRRNRAVIDEDIRIMNESIPALESELEKLRGEKAGVEAGVDPELIAQYRRIADAHKGVALAEAKNELCGVCHVRIRPQMYADLLLTETIMFCDSCSRILFVREE